ncbi:hypothetical protein EON82_10360 [bacterium]|nr:MAG: hypothetical protein EON82_10360 [bacterium]
MEGALRFVLPLVALVVAGCHGSAADAPLPKYADDPTPYAPRSGSGNAFDAYVLAASDVNAEVQGLGFDPLGRTFFTPQQREKIIQAVRPALSRLARTTSPCEFQYVPQKPGEPVPYRAEWRLLGRALRWGIDDDLAKEDTSSALGKVAVAMRFAADLCGGGPSDRTLGVEIANDVRDAIVPSLPKLAPADLHRLADGVKSALRRRKPLKDTLDNGEKDMLLALQALQDGFQKNELAAIQKAMGREFRDLQSPLEEFKKKSDKRTAFFEGLHGDLQRLSDAWRAAALLPASERAEVLKVKLKGDRPRKAFARHFFLLGKPLLEIEDRSVAQLRLLVLEAELRRVVRLAGRAPSSLSAVKPPWATDPYTGRTFGYLPDGAEFRIYSVGANLKDDLGDTDEAGLSPDIRTVLPN